MNATRDFMSITFTGGREVQRACIAPTGFHLTDKGTYAAVNVIPGGVASLCFVEAGEYSFLVSRLALSGRSLNPIVGRISVK